MIYMSAYLYINTFEPDPDFNPPIPGGNEG